jgi:opacity protein-like surface antigen
MKSFLITLLFATCITSLSFSQEPQREGASQNEESEFIVKFGVRGGFNISNLDFDPDATFENKHRNGFAFGGFIDMAFNDSFSILAELQYSAEGAEDQELRIDYIQLPIFFRLELVEDFTIGVGPMVSLKTWEFEDGFNNFAFSGVAGLEYMLDEDLFVDLRYHYGLGNILDTNLSSSEAINMNIQIGFGIKL